MNTYILDQKSFVYIVLSILMVTFGTQNISYAQEANPTLTASVEEPLTEATLHGSIITLTLSGATFQRGVIVINEITISGDEDATLNVSEWGLVSDRQMIIKLEFAGNIDTDATFAITLGAQTIAGDNGNPLTATLPVTAVEESLAASTEAPLTEATLDEPITLTLNGRQFIDAGGIEGALSVSGIEGVTDWNVRRVSDTEAIVWLRFAGNIETDAVLTLTVGPDAISYDKAFTFQFPVTAVEESLVASTEAPLTEATLNGSIITLTLTGRQFTWYSEYEMSVSGIEGVTIERWEVDGVSDTKATLELGFSGNIDTDAVLTLTVGPDAIGYDKSFTFQFPVTPKVEYQLMIISGNNQEAVINTALANPLVVEVRDQYDNPSPDVQVTFTVTGGEGLLSGESTTVEVTTDANGRAAQTLTVGPYPRIKNFVNVSIGRERVWLRESVTFEAYGISPYQLERISGNNQQGQFGSALAEPLVVELRDWQGNLLPNTQVKFDVSEGEALLNGESKTIELTTDINGRAAASLVLGYTIGNRVTVSIGHESETFSATGNSPSYSDTFSSSAYGLLSPDGRTIAIPSSYTNEMDSEDIYTVELWDVDTHTLVTTLGRRTDDIVPLSFSPDGTRLATTSADNTVKLWDVAGQANIATLEGHGRVVTFVAFSPDGTFLATGAWDGVVTVWDVATHEKIATLGGHRTEVLNNRTGGWPAPVAFSPDGTTLVYGAVEEIKFWDVATRQEIAAIDAHPEGVISLSFSSDGTILASNSVAAIKLWNVETRENIPSSISKVDGGIFQIAFVPNSTVLAYTSVISDVVVLWDVTKDLPIANLEGHARGVEFLSFSADGTTLASSSETTFASSSRYRVKLWDIAEARLSRPSHLVKISGEAQQGWLGMPLPKPLVVEVRDQYDNPFPGAQVTFTVTGGGGKLNGQSKVERVTTDADGKAAISLTVGHTTVNSVDASLAGTGFVGNPWVRFNILISPYDVTILEGYNQGATSVAFSPDGTLLASWDEDSGVKLWDVETHTDVVAFSYTDILSVAFSPDGRTLAFSADHVVGLWDIETKQNIATLEGHRWSATSVVFSPNGMLLASGSGDATIKLWDVETKENIATLDGHGRGVTSVAFSPDGTLLASGSVDATVKLWDVETKENIATLDGHTDDVTSVVFSSDGTLLASGSDDATVKLWDVETKENIATLDGHTDDVTSVAFSPDGTLLASTLLASGFDDDTVKLWDVETKENINTLITYTGDVFSVAFSPDGKTLASGTGNGTVELWDISSFITFPTSPESLKADINGDGVVNMADLVLVASNYGQTGENVADVNGDGVVHIYDIILVASQIDTDTAAPSLHARDLSMLTATEVKQWLSAAQQLDITNAMSQRGILFLQQLLAALIPKETALLANFPNPFNPETWIPYQLAKPTEVTITIYNINGHVVRTLELGHQAAGMYQNRSRAAYWDGRNAFGEPVASGVYFYTITAGDFTATRKMLIRK